MGGSRAGGSSVDGSRVGGSSVGGSRAGGSTALKVRGSINSANMG